jgi:uncharacterized protein YndB with AHSA1/START domain
MPVGAAPPLHLQAAGCTSVHTAVHGTQKLHMSSTDRIEKRVFLHAPVARVWRALVDTQEFGSWFGFLLEGPFAEGKTIKGTAINGATDEAALMASQVTLGVEPAPLRLPVGATVFCTVGHIEPERYFSFRWIPYAIDAETELTGEPTTLVEFLLAPTSDGTMLTIVESGFDGVPAARRLRAFRMNEGGWAGQATNLRKYVEEP